MSMFPLPPITPLPAREPPPMVRNEGREDVSWDRPIFRAPPLEFFLKPIDAQTYAADLRRIRRGER